jgi:hypothetical protein
MASDLCEKIYFLLTTGLEPATYKEKILSLPCMPIPPSELFKNKVGTHHTQPSYNKRGVKKCMI